MPNRTSYNIFSFTIAIRCPRLRRPNYGEIYPADCTRSRMLFGARCAFSCHAGFQLQGPSLRNCVTPGRWDGGNLMTICVGTPFIFSVNFVLLVILFSIYIKKTLNIFFQLALLKFSVFSR